MVFKICSKFNTVEWEAKELPSKEELQKVYDLISSIQVKDEDMPQRAVKKSTDKPTGKPIDTRPATDKQLAAMAWMGIPVPDKCSITQARDLMLKWNAEHNTDK